MSITTLRNFALLPLQIQHRSINIDDAKAALRAHPTREVLDELRGFGDLMMSEVVSRAGLLETKALGALGWASVILAFLLLGGPTWRNVAWWQTCGLVLGALAALFSAERSFDALRVRKWTWPSQRDWFRSDLFDDVNSLRIYHLLALLENHETHSLANGEKARSLEWAQWGLLLAALLIALTFLLTLLLG